MGNLTSVKGCNNPFFKGSTTGTDFSERSIKAFQNLLNCSWEFELSSSYLQPG